MIDLINLFQLIQSNEALGEISLEKDYLGLYGGEVVYPAIAEIVNNDNASTTGNELLDKMAPYEARAACD
jgi:hypothetical protein